MENKVYVVKSEVISYDDAFSTIEGVNRTLAGAKERLLKVVEIMCANIKESSNEDFNDEDYADDFDGYNSFEEFWDDWVKERFYGDETFWQYDECDGHQITIEIQALNIGD